MELAVDGGFTGFDTLSENIEERILDSIRKGISSGENRALRPLREVFQIVMMNLQIGFTS